MRDQGGQNNPSDSTRSVPVCYRGRREGGCKVYYRERNAVHVVDEDIVLLSLNGLDCISFPIALKIICQRGAWSPKQNDKEL